MHVVRRLRRPGPSVTRGVRRPSRPRAPEERRLRLLEAARELLMERGPEGVSVEAIARRAGVAKGTFYLYFGSRDQLLESVRGRWIEGFLSGASRPEPGDWPARVRALVELVVDLLLGEPRLHLALLHPRSGSGQPPAALGALEERVARSIREAREAGVPGLPEPWPAAAFLVHGVHGALDRCLGTQTGTVERARLVEETVRLAGRLLGAAVEPRPGGEVVAPAPPPDAGTPR